MCSHSDKLVIITFYNMCINATGNRNRKRITVVAVVRCYCIIWLMPINALSKDLFFVSAFNAFHAPNFSLCSNFIAFLEIPLLSFQSLFFGWTWTMCVKSMKWPQLLNANWSTAAEKKQNTENSHIDRPFVLFVFLFVTYCSYLCVISSSIFLVSI